MTVIDAHLHLWERDRGYHWLDDAPEPLRADFTADRARAELDLAGVDTAILVQADDTEADTGFLLDTADAHDWIVGVVGWLPIDDAARAEEMLDHWSDRPVLHGVRQLLHDDPRDGQLSRPDARRLAALLAERGLALDVPNAFPRLLGDATALAASEPGLTVVIDHLAKPPADPDRFDVWSEQLAAVAALPNTVGKVSGLSEAGRRFSAADASRAWEVALERFGPDRLMLGGDWPITVTSGGYAPVWAALTELVDTLSPSERAMLRSGTATRVYRLDEPGGQA